MRRLRWSRTNNRLLRAARTVDRFDMLSSTALAAMPFPTAIDRGLPLLTRAADHSKLWIATSAGLVATGQPRLRRAGLRGIGSVAVASAVGNLVAKRLFVRKRPLIESLPLRRAAHRIPTSNSFPSGHTASAAAFAIGAAIECPPLAVPLGLLAAGVGASRVYTGVHYPSDVAAGAAIGAAVAVAGRTLVPARRTDSVGTCTDPEEPQKPRPTGSGVVAVLNPGSGSADCETLAASLRDALPDIDLVTVADGDDIAAVLADAASRAEVLAAAGGDGTINAAAKVAMAADVPLLVLPAGTFDHFAKDLGLVDIATAVEAVRTGHAVRVDVGEVAGEPFLNTASLGSYPEFVRVRERREDRWGKPIAAALALVDVWRKCPPLVAEIDGGRRELLLLFVGNGEYEPRGFLPRRRSRLSSGVLDVRFADADRGSHRGLIGAALTSSLYRSSAYVEQIRDDLTVRLPGDAGLLARDGEVDQAPEEVTFRVRHGALVVFCGRSPA